MNIASYTKKYALTLFVIAIISGSIKEINFVYYTVPLFLILFISAGFKDIKFSEIRFGSLFNQNKDDSDTGFPFMLLLLVIAIAIWYTSSALWSDYPMLSLQRGFYFGLLATGCILGGYLWMKESGKGLFDYMLPANIIIIALSIFSLITNIPGDSWTGGNGKGFMGFFGHQNLLGSLILFTVPAVFFKLISGRHSVRHRQIDPASGPQQVDHHPESGIQYPVSGIIFYSLLLTFNLLILALTYSRASWLSLAAGIALFLILIKSWKILIISFSLFTFIFFLILTFPSLNKTFNKIILKDFNTVFESRVYLWESSLKAAKLGGLVGLGYGISEPNIIVPGTGSHYEGERYEREKGNSLLALVEETGLIGLVLFMLPIGYVIRKHGCMVAWRHEAITQSANAQSGRHSIVQSPNGQACNHAIIQSYNHIVLLAALASLLLHSQFEAWMVGVGSIQLPLFFIVLGITNYNSIIQSPIQ